VVPALRNVVTSRACGAASSRSGPDAPGLVVLSHDWGVESTTPGVERWLAELPDGDWDAGKLPSSVLAVAGRALRTADHPDEPGQVAVSRVLSRSGTWVVLHGAALVSGGARRVAVIVEPAHPARIAPLLMSAYGLTVRSHPDRGYIASNGPDRSSSLRALSTQHPRPRSGGLLTTVWCGCRA
jgi:hypothetical protein